MNEDDEWFWELLEEQHNHDVRISGAQEGELNDQRASDNLPTERRL